MFAPALQTEFAGRRGRLFWLALRTSVMTVLTLGLYRFWMKTRLRRYYWSSVRPGGVPLEYVGEPLEKLLGFLIAVVFLAFYIGIVNLFLMFASFAILHGNMLAYVLSFVGVIPFIFYAQYRARRYILARTRWRGIRFGLEPGAWGYAWRALEHWILTILTLGLLWPRMTFKLEKYRTDRTFFGTQRMDQGGTWTMLYPKFVTLVLGIAFCALLILAAVGGMTVALWGLVVGVPWVGYGLVRYRVEAFRLLTDHKTAGEIGFRASPSAARVFRIHLFGGLLLAVALLLAMVALAFAAAFAAQALFGEADIFSDLDRMAQAIPAWFSATAGVTLYFAFFILWGVLVHVLIRLPRARHYAETLEITGAGGLPAIRQRARDEHTEAEGFAEALDVGAAI